MMIKRILMSVVILCSGTACASEQSEAIEACKRVEKLRVAELQAKNKAASSIEDMCHMTTRTRTFFECIEKKMGEGNEWLFSSARCDNVE